MIDSSEKRKEVKKKLRKLEGLPTLPPIVQKLNLLIEDERVSLHQIADLIEKDQVITTKVLRLANSAFYGFPRKVSTVSQAMMLLGMNVLKILIMTSSIFDIIHKEDVGLWEHSIGVAACAKIIAEKTEIKDPQEIATAGLLHDLGRVIEMVSFREESKEIIALISQGEEPLQAERKILGLDHAEIGAFLMRQWNLPERLIEAVSAHHQLDLSKKFKKESACLHLSDVLVHARGYGRTLYDKVPPLDPSVFKILGLSLPEIKEIIFSLEPKLYELKFFTEELKKELS
ncbi:HD family phosphohydrolase [Caldimicrobium thiodismutans]|jgi:putative nucleotidyltransferase with HDIG domain|uniref:HD family phosphohydrolase n=1 Tax=Caldimicrobium thiodismutans TaxID=1653476 RepID=A0A0U4W530_9BACT|nr:HDOD domain-containing protein [Caldimicrobium thiodismutans]BAU24173.1 HD family phosphohydrolase [Caldimicrobium thiodismutans]